MPSEQTLELLQARDDLIAGKDGRRELLFEAASGTSGVSALEAGRHLAEIGRKNPSALKEEVERLASFATSTDDARLRSDFAEALCYVIEAYPGEGETVTDALETLVSVEDKSLYQTNARAQRDAVRYTLDAWVAISEADIDVRIPDEVITETAKFVQIADANCLRTICRVLERAALQPLFIEGFAPTNLLLELLGSPNQKAAYPAARAVNDLALENPRTFSDPGIAASRLRDAQNQFDSTFPQVTTAIETLEQLAD